MDDRVAGRGWYPDPWFSGQHRYWTGRGWTGDVFADGHAEVTLRPETERPNESPPVTRSATPPPPPSFAYTPPATGFAAWDFLESSAPAAAAERPKRRLTARQLNILALVAGLLLGFGVVEKAVAGRSHDDARASPPVTDQPVLPQPSTQPSSAPTTQPSAPLSGDRDAAVLQQLVVRQTDVPATSRVQLLPGGNKVSGETTLDLCNGRFPSEALRTARLQVVEYAGTGLAALSTEAVLYRTPAQAAQAIREVQRVAAGCPNGPVVSPVGEPTVTTQFRARPDASWPATTGVQRLAYAVTTTDQLGIGDDHVAVYLRRGRVLEGVYFPAPEVQQPAVNGQATVVGIVGVFENRLATLPASVVNG